MPIKTPSLLDAYGREIKYRDNYDAGLKPVITDVKCVNFVSTSSQYITCGTSGGDYEYNTPFSASFWFKGSSISWDVIMSKHNAITNIGWFIMTYDSTASGRIPGSLAFGLYHNPSMWLVTYAKKNICDGAWHHAACKYNGSGNPSSSISFVIDGVSVGTQTNGTSLSLTIKASGLELRMGMYNWAGGSPGTEFLDGKLDEFSLYNKELSLAESQEIFGAGKPTHLNTLTTSRYMDHWWRMGDQTDAYPTIYDRRGTAHGTMVNMSGANIVTDAP
jgi:hypothetical protein